MYSLKIGLNVQTITDGPTPVQRRSILCVDKRDQVLPDSICGQDERPNDTQHCHNLPICRGKHPSKKELLSGDPIDMLDDETYTEEKLLDAIDEELSDDENSEENQV